MCLCLSIGTCDYTRLPEIAKGNPCGIGLLHRSINVITKHNVVLPTSMELLVYSQPHVKSYQIFVRIR